MGSADSVRGRSSGANTLGAGGGGGIKAGNGNVATPQSEANK